MRISDSAEEKAVKLRTHDTELNDIKTKISKGLGALEHRIDTQYTLYEERINALEQNLEARIDKGLHDLKETINTQQVLSEDKISALEYKLDSRMASLESKMDSLVLLMQQVLRAGDQSKNNR